MPRFALLPPLAAALLVACGGTETTTEPGPTPGTPVAMTVLGRGDFKPARTTGEIFVRGNTAYTTTWSNQTSSSVFYVWDVAANVPTLLDSVRVENATTLGDIAVSDDGSLLVVATELTPGSIVVYSLADPRKPQFVSRYTNDVTNPGVHTAEIGRVNGKLYGFLSIDPSFSTAARIHIVDLSNPASPQGVLTRVAGRPFVHDTFVRDGLLFLGLWNDGLGIWDIGGGGKGGTPANPVAIGSVATAGGEAHNMWWVKDPANGTARYVLVGEEGPTQSGVSSIGDVHVIDVSNMAQPREVAFYTVPGAGSHNFSVDEQNGILYAAYYNGGVRALDVRGDLGTCTEEQKSRPAGSATALCDLRKMGRELGTGLLGVGNPVFVWGVHYQNGVVYASDMLNGIWKLQALSRP